MSEPAPAGNETGEFTVSRRHLKIASIVGGIVLLCLAGAVVIFVGLRGADQTADGTPPSPELEAPVGPTPDCEVIVSSGDVEISIGLPVALTAKGITFSLEPIAPEVETWSYPAERSDVALWLCGTVVNYVVGLEPTAENEALLTSLVTGDPIELQFANGTGLRFSFGERRTAPAGDESVMAQRSPQLTLVLAADETWEVATAAYLAEEGPIDPAVPEGAGQVGQAVVVGDVRVTVTQAYTHRADDLPPGATYYLVEFSVENMGDADLATHPFSMRLLDDLGNTYLVSRSASEAGRNGPLSGEIAPGASAQATAGYLVPQRLPGSSLRWVFTPRPGLETAGIVIPHKGEEGPDAEAQAEVIIDDAFLSDDGGTLIILGQVRNQGAHPLTVESTAIVLTSDDGTGELISTTPRLPWLVEAGQTQLIELQYRRPDTSVAILELLAHSFEIGGLR